MVSRTVCGRRFWFGGVGLLCNRQTSDGIWRPETSPLCFVFPSAGPLRHRVAKKHSLVIMFFRWLKLVENGENIAVTKSCCWPISRTFPWLGPTTAAARPKLCQTKAVYHFILRVIRHCPLPSLPAGRGFYWAWGRARDVEASGPLALEISKRLETEWCRCQSMLHGARGLGGVHVGETCETR